MRPELKNKVEELSKILADRYGHGMAEKCVTQAEVALEVLGDRITQLEQEYELCKLANKSLKDALDDERKIIEAQKYVMEALQKERDALKAHLGRLHPLVEHLANIGSDFGFGPYQPGAQEIKAAQVALDESPDQSLAEIQAQAVEDASGKVCQLWAGVKDGHALSMCEYSELIEHAKQLREGAK